MRFRNCLPPFSDRYSRGPYYYAKWGRYRIDLLSPLGRGHCLSITYARYLVSIRDGKEPVSPYEVDHIDGDRTHDEFSNLQVISRKENTIKGRRTPSNDKLFKVMRTTCPYCKKTFEKPVSQTHVGKGTGNKTYCSRSCSRKWRTCEGVIQTFDIIFPPIFAPSMVIEPWEENSTECLNKLIPIRELSALKCEVCSTLFRPRARTQKTCSLSCANVLTSSKNKIVCDDTIREAVHKVLRKEMSWSSAGRLLGISDNAIRKRARKLGLIK